MRRRSPTPRRPGPGILVILAIATAAPASLDAQQTRRMIIATNVVCREQPDPEAHVAHRYTPGDEVAVQDSTVAGAATWYLDGWHVRGARECWVYGPLTTPYDRARPEPAILAAVDRLLARDDAPFMDHVAVHNLLLSRHDLLEASPLLQLRRLQVVDAAMDAPDAYRPHVQGDPLRLAWVLSHGADLRYFESSEQWLTWPEVYWRLYDRHHDSEWAEEIAWAAAHGEVPADECYAECALDGIERRWARYWDAFPRGPHVDEAVDEAIETVEVTIRYCDPDFSDAGAVRQSIAAIREGLGDVAAGRKGELLELLRRMERECL